MEQALAYSTLAMTVALAVSRPRLWRSRLRITPGIAAVLGVLALLLTGLLRLEDLVTSAQVQWRPLLALTAIMVMTGVVKEVGTFERLALRLEAHARTTSARRAFDIVFVASVVTPSLLNNDAAILLLTPVVIVLARRLYPGQPKVLEAFVFAVFLAPGVAPFLISNPMNMIVAEFAGVGFNAYAAVMRPISIVGAAITYVVLRLHYRRALTAIATPAAAPEERAPHRAERPATVLMLAVFCSYPVMAALGGPIWSIAVVGALGCLVIARRYRVASARALAGHVSIDILAFLWGVFLVVAALRNVGLVDRLAGLYEAQPVGGRQLATVGVVAALGSAIVDNHPMSILNMMALGSHGGSRPLFAALIGGDIGPRLLPIGSLAGLLWMDLLRRRGIEIGIGKFVKLGTLVLIPTLAVSLLMLWLLF
jgi:arsenical pump membrane protein